MIPPDAEEMRVRAVCRLIITNAIRFLTNHTSTVTLCGIPGPRAIGKESRLHILEVLWALAFLPSYVSLHITWNTSPSLAYCICTPAQCSTHILEGQPVNNNHAFCVDWNLLYWHRPCWKTYRERTRDLTGVRICLWWCKIRFVRNDRT